MMNFILDHDFILLVETAGTLMVAWAAIRVHHKVLQERVMDEEVYRSIKFEQYIGIAGMVLIFLSFIAQIIL